MKKFNFTTYSFLVFLFLSIPFTTYSEEREIPDEKTFSILTSLNKTYNSESFFIEFPNAPKETRPASQNEIYLRAISYEVSYDLHVFKTKFESHIDETSIFDTYKDIISNFQQRALLNDWQFSHSYSTSNERRCLDCKIEKEEKVTLYRILITNNNTYCLSTVYKNGKSQYHDYFVQSLSITEGVVLENEDAHSLLNEEDMEFDDIDIDEEDTDFNDDDMEFDEDNEIVEDDEIEDNANVVSDEDHIVSDEFDDNHQNFHDDNSSSETYDNDNLVDDTMDFDTDDDNSTFDEDNVDDDNSNIDFGDDMDFNDDMDFGDDTDFKNDMSF